jgi:hypothetical protein
VRIEGSLQRRNARGREEIKEEEKEAKKGRVVKGAGWNLKKLLDERCCDG